MINSAEKAYQQLLNDVEDYAEHAGRKRVTVDDHFLLFKRLFYFIYLKQFVDQFLSTGCD